MQFDILNELLTSTVFSLFQPTQPTISETKARVKQLEGLFKNQTAVKQAPLRECKSVEEWIKIQAPRRLKESIQKLGVTEDLLLNSRRKQELDAYVGNMTLEKLSADKKKVKNELRCYDSDFYELFHSQPNHEQKQPFRPLYVYYKKLKQYIVLRDENNMSVEEIEKKIREIKAERRDLRTMVEGYQKDFEGANNRRIKYERDIAPIKNEYNRYKELKIELAKMEEMLSNK